MRIEHCSTLLTIAWGNREYNASCWTYTAQMVLYPWRVVDRSCLMKNTY